MEPIKVSLRIRPLNPAEIQANNTVIWQIQNSTSLHLEKTALSTLISNRIALPPKISSYDFSACFDKQTDNYAIYHEFAKEATLSSLKGINGTIFLYGQTGAGKTFTMLGGAHQRFFESEDIQGYIRQIVRQKQFNNLGVLLYSLMEIFKQINKDANHFYHLKCSYFEIYNESVYDLLSASEDDYYSRALPIVINRETQEFEVKNISQLPVTKLEQIIRYIQVGEQNRHYAETMLNHQSSRSHTIFKLHISVFKQKTQQTSQQGFLRSSLSFVDLAGSERLSMSENDYFKQFYGVDEADLRQSHKFRQQESQVINKSLFYLTRVIALKSSKNPGHIPFRNSALTKLMKASLVGNSKTGIILCINPTLSHFEQSLQTIKLGENAKLIENKVDANLVDYHSSNTHTIKVIQSLKEKLAAMETAYHDQQQQLINTQQQLSKSLQDREHLLDQIRKMSKSEFIKHKVNSYLHEKQPDKPALSYSSSQAHKDELDKIENILVDYEGSIVLDRYKQIIQQLQAQQLKNYKLEEECEQLYSRINKHDCIIQNYTQAHKENDANLDAHKDSSLKEQSTSQDLSIDRKPSERRDPPPEPFPEPDDVSFHNSALTPIRKKTKISYSNFDYSSSGSISRSYEGDFEKQINLMIQKWDSGVLESQKKSSTPSSKKTKPVQRKKKEERSVKHVRSLSSENQKKDAPILKDVRSISSKKGSEIQKLSGDIQSFAEKLLHLSTKFELEKQQEDKEEVREVSTSTSPSPSPGLVIQIQTSHTPTPSKSKHRASMQRSPKLNKAPTPKPQENMSFRQRIKHTAQNKYFTNPKPRQEDKKQPVQSPPQTQHQKQVFKSLNKFQIADVIMETESEQSEC